MKNSLSQIKSMLDNHIASSAAPSPSDAFAPLENGVTNNYTMHFGSCSAMVKGKKKKIPTTQYCIPAKRNQISTNPISTCIPQACIFA